MKKFLILIPFITSIYLILPANSSDKEIYKKIDLFGEVLEKINNEYVDEVNQSESMDSAINGLLQSLDPYSAYMSPEIFDEMQTETSGEFGGLGIEVGMESGVVKVISPIDDTPASRAGIKAGDYIVKINDTQVQGKSLSEAVELMRGPVGSDIDITIRRIGKKKALKFTITREIIEVASVKAEIKNKNVGYIRIEKKKEEYQTSWAILKKYSGKGITSRNLKKATNKKIKYVAKIKRDNIASIQVAKKSGFKFFSKNKNLIYIK